MPKISPMSVVDPHAVIADDVEIGPFCTVGPKVKLGPGNRLISHVVIEGRTTIGRNNIFFPHCVIGAAPQDLKYRGGDTLLEIGDNNHFRESSTVHIGTEVGGGLTRIGNGNLIMINCHIAHDVLMADHCILANNVMLAGHIVCGNHVNMGGAVGVNHYVSIGDFAYIGGQARVTHDVPPFVKVDAANCVRALNKTGLQRAGFSPEDITALDDAFRALFIRETPLSVTLKQFDSLIGLNPHVKCLIDFLRRRDQGRHGRYLESQRTA
jgi:UDP-N-acetylglucosamine acyltransferase